MTTSGSAWAESIGPALAGAGGAALEDSRAALVEALHEVRDAVADTAYPLALTGAGPARRLRTNLLAQLDDYLLPRLRRFDAPLLVVVGGSTGAGKSTLVNSLIRAPVSSAGALRPTTRVPVLVCHPNDMPWFTEQDLLPGLSRSRGARERSIQLLAALGLTPGLALLDAPDLDSVVETNRSQAREVLAAADIWLFVTTAARYADAVPWQVLAQARQRGTPVAVVLDRVPAAAKDAVAAHLTHMLGEHDLGGVPLFVISQSTLDGQGLLAEAEVASVKHWIDRIARSSVRRAATIRWTYRGAVRAVAPRVQRLATAADDQVSAATRLAQLVRDGYAVAESRVETTLYDGTLLRGEVLGRWRELTSRGDLKRSVRARGGSRSGQVSAALRGTSVVGRQFADALSTALVMLIRDAAATAAELAYRSWLADPAGQSLATSDPRLSRASPGFGDWAEHLVREWQRWIRAAVQADQANGRDQRVSASVLLVMVATVLPDPTVMVDRDPTFVAALADPGTHEIAVRGRAELLIRVGELFVAEAARFGEPLVRAGVDGRCPARLRAAATAIMQALSLFPGRVSAGRGAA